MVKKKKARPTGGLMREYSDYFTSPEYDEEAERLAEDLALASIEARMMEIPPTPIVFLKEWEGLEFEKNLIRFAREKRVSLSDENWRTTTLELAAREHPKLQSGKRKRGRPKNRLEGGLYGPLSPIDDDVYQAVKNIRARVTKRNGKPISRAAACRLIVAIQETSIGLSPDPDEAGFKAKVKNLQRKYTEQKKLKHG